MLLAALVAITLLRSWLACVAVPPRSLGAVAFLALFAVTLPWPVIGFWNAVIGFLIMRLHQDSATAVNPLVARSRGDEPITSSTAILMCIRNESPAQVIRNLEPLLNGLVQAQAAHLFHVYLLSDSSDPDVIAEEGSHFEPFMAKWNSTIPVTYRRRLVNTAFKAGNIRDFCDRWGYNHTFALTLDADSFMPAEAVLRVVRIMQGESEARHPPDADCRHAVAQPARARVSIWHAARHALLPLGATWWQADCGPLIAQCHPAARTVHRPLPPAGIAGRGALAGPILSHDQVEAVLMRRAGYDVRVLVQEGLGFEQNPPTLLEFTRRDLRWCQGNMQYWRLLTLPGLKAVSRFQLIFAILMYLGSPAWMAMTALGIVLLMLSDGPSGAYVPVEVGAGTVLFAIMLLMTFAPKIASIIDVMLTPAMRRLFGGTLVFVLNILAGTHRDFTDAGHRLHQLPHASLCARRSTDRAAAKATRCHGASPLQLASDAGGLHDIGCRRQGAQRSPLRQLGATGLILAVPFAVLTASP